MTVTPADIDEARARANDAIERRRKCPLGGCVICEDAVKDTEAVVEMLLAERWAGEGAREETA